MTSRRWGVSMERRIFEINRFTVGWTAYYSYADTPWPFEKLDKWLGRRLRQVRWKQWKRVRTKRRRLIALGIPAGDAHKWACSRKGYWRISSSPILNRALPTAYWTHQGLEGFLEPYRRFRDAKEPPGADPHAGWCGGRRGKPGAYPIPRRTAPARVPPGPR
jgi:RNA-directed DNA polymerase